MPRTLPTRFAARAAATARVAAHLGAAGARRLVSRSEDDDRALGDALVRELDGLKGLAMKVGQILSYLDVGLPDATTARLAELQRGLAPLPFEVVRERIEEALGAPLATLFDSFDPAPIAAASIGQVHRAVCAGRPVAVKVQYPGVRDTLVSDFRQLGAIASVASLATAVDGPALVAEVRARILKECDYGVEAENQRSFAAIVDGDPALAESILVPEVVPSRSAATVLTTAWWDGDRFETVVLADAERRNAVAHTLVSLPWRTLLGANLLHADPHPGNFVFVGGGRVAVLDYGAVKRVDDRDRAAFAALVRAVLDDARDALGDVAGDTGLLGHPDKIDYDELWAMLRWMFAPYLGPTFRFDRAYWLAGRRFSAPNAPNARHLAFPPTWLWIQRTLYGLHAVLVKLGAEGTFAPLVRGALEAR